MTHRTPAAMIAFFVSDAGGYVSGTRIRVDGGGGAFR